ncbi:MAG TPA: tyrosine-type recombinase/integrase [Terriglobales bacterium]|nr:tyrosine-type recombinase/integrase [Terriglobales bacterium]
MSLWRPKGSTVWWYSFKFDGKAIRESSKSHSKTVARKALNARRRELEENFNGIKKRKLPMTFTEASAEYLKAKKGDIADSSYEIEERNIGHLLPTFGRKLLNEISAQAIKDYRTWRLQQLARPDRKNTTALIKPKTVNLEIATMRAILRRNGMWEQIRKDLRMLKVEDGCGHELTKDEEARLDSECRKSQSRSLYPAYSLALSTGMRFSDERFLRWGRIDLERGEMRVGKSKTDAGTGRGIPLNRRALTALREWAAQFPDRQPEHYVFPTEKITQPKRGTTEPVIYAHNPLKPMGSWKTAWTTARKNAKVWIRFHDLRHTAVSRMVRAGVPLAVIGDLLGWSASTLLLMIKKYAHLSAAFKDAVATLDEPEAPRNATALEDEGDCYSPPPDFEHACADDFDPEITTDLVELSWQAHQQCLSSRTGEEGFGS